MDRVQLSISNGASIKWVGYHSNRCVRVDVVLDGKMLSELVYLEEDYTSEDFSWVVSASADVPGTNVGTIWGSGTLLDTLRLASILGLNAGSDAVPGIGKKSRGSIGCIMAYDIEQDRSRLPLSSFPTASESITCIATYCSCGDRQLFSFIRGVEFEYVVCRSSLQTVSKFMEHVREHSPQWLVGYNSFRYDNTCIAFHSDESHAKNFIKLRTGSGSSLSYSFYIDIPGTYNVDLLVYLDKTQRSNYTNMSLATVVEHHGIEGKMQFDTSDTSNAKMLFEYNMHDSMITMKLAQCSGCIEEILSLCVASCSPVIDCARFVSGTLAACSIASYCLHHRIRMDWSPCTRTQDYRGAEVLSPLIGMHKNVALCDFSSMYPTILMDSNISIENYTIKDSKLSVGATWTDTSSTYFSMGHKAVAFDRSPGYIVPPVMRFLVEERRRVRKTNQSHASALKVVANSIYGSLGDRHSRIYSPMCSAAVTTGGRWCLSVAETVLRRLGYLVVYGDTDSCFVAPSKQCPIDIHNATRILSLVFRNTAFPSMSMEVEHTYEKIALLGKKTYFGRLDNGAIVSKGMSKSRKDRIGICRTFSSMVVPVVLSSSQTTSIRRAVGNMMCVVIDSMVSGKLTLAQISKIVKRGGTSYYEYTAASKNKEWKECESYSGHELVSYSPEHVMKSLKREIQSILAVSGTGNIASVISSSSVI